MYRSKIKIHQDPFQVEHFDVAEAESSSSGEDEERLSDKNADMFDQETCLVFLLNQKRVFCSYCFILVK